MILLSLKLGKELKHNYIDQRLQREHRINNKNNYYANRERYGTLQDIIAHYS